MKNVTFVFFVLYLIVFWAAATVRGLAGEMLPLKDWLITAGVVLVFVYYVYVPRKS